MPIRKLENDRKKEDVLRNWINSEQWIHDGEPARPTVKQKLILLWLAMECKNKKMTTIPCMYRRIGAALGMSKRAARVHVAALEKKKLIWSYVAYHPNNSRQAVGKRILIPQDVYIFLEMQVSNLKKGDD